MVKQETSTLILLGLLFFPAVFCSQVCTYQPQQGKYLNECINNCQSYSTLDIAISACNGLSNCGGVTLSKVGFSQSGLSTQQALSGDFGYQLRSTTVLVNSEHGEDSWVKVSCTDISTPCYTTQAYTEMSNCSLGCKDFQYLKDAVAACNNEPTCYAVTYSQKQFGTSITTGASGNGWGYQLRTGTLLKSDQYEISWVKGTCPNGVYNNPAPISFVATGKPTMRKQIKKQRSI